MKLLFTDPIPGRRVVGARLEQLTLSSGNNVTGFVAKFDEDNVPLESQRFELVTTAEELVAAAVAEVIRALQNGAATISQLTLREDNSVNVQLLFNTDNAQLVAAVQQVTLGALVTMGELPPGSVVPE